MSERGTVVHEVNWNTEEIAAVGMDAVSFIYIERRGKANTDFLRIASAWNKLKNNSMSDQVVQQPGDNLSVRIHRPISFVPILDEQGNEPVLDQPFIKVEMESPDGVGLRYRYLQELGKLSIILKEMSKYLRLEWNRRDELRLTFPMSVYAEHIKDTQIVLIN